MADIYDKAKRSQLMSCVRQSRTEPEEKVKSILEDLKIRYQRNVKKLPGSPDFAIPSAKTVIFVHGCFWHAHLNCKLARRPKTNNKFWTKKAVDNRRRDARKNYFLRKAGWRVITIWQCRLRKPEQVTKRLRRILYKHS
ncbi:MAG: DNA mismatch endonuclease Vsr [Phycisphaerae bacterium]|jgi:DNA mismatch endonuclease (patch repair protein)